MSSTSFSEEERLARSERAKALHAQGKLGGAEFGKLGGRPRKKRASEIAAERIAEKGEALVQELLDLALNSESEKIRSENIKLALAIEEQERKATVEEEVRYDQLKHADLTELVIENLFGLLREGKIDIGSFDIEGEVVEEGRLIGSGEEDERT